MKTVTVEMPVRLTARMVVEVEDDWTLATAWEAVTREVLKDAYVNEDGMWDALKDAWRNPDGVWAWEEDADGEVGRTEGPGEMTDEGMLVAEC